MVNRNINGDVLYLTFPELERYSFIKHAFSTRLGGVSKNEFSSMNLSFNRGDPDNNVIENYNRLCKACGIDINTLVASHQVHGTNVKKVSEKDCGKGIFKDKFEEGVDALVTDAKYVTLVTYFADCVPLYFVDINKKVIGLAHAGWRGTVNLIAAKTINKMKEEYGSNPCDIVCVIGPSIGKCCYEVNEDVKNSIDFLNLRGSIITKKDNGKHMLDLWELNREILLNCSIPDKNIFLSSICTSCNSDILFSHRVTNGKRGGMAAFLCLV